MLKTTPPKSSYCTALTLVLFWPSLFLAQILYPVKIDHKWAYIDYRGEVLVKPGYDLIDTKELPWHGMQLTDHSSGFKLVELEGKLGLIDQQKKEVLRPAYQKIRPLSPHFFAVQIDSLFTVVDRAGNILIDQRYPDIQVLDRTQTGGNIFFKVKVGEAWGVYQAGKGQILPAEYKEIRLVNAERKYFQVQKEASDHWGMVNEKNTLILPYQFDQIKGYHPNFIASRADMASIWQVRDSLGQVKMDSIWFSFLPLNKHLIQLQDSSWKIYLYAFEKNDTISVSKKYDSYAPLNDQYILGRLNRNYAILDNSGRELLEPAYSNIKPYTLPDQFKVRKNFLWGIYKLGEGEVLNTDYDSIGPFHNSFAKVIRARKMGMINDNFEEIIPPTYDSVKMDGRFFKAFNRNQLSVFELGDDKKIKGVEDFSQVFTLKVGTQRHYKGPPIEAEVVERKDKTNNEGHFFEHFGSPLVLDHTPWHWKYDREAKRWGLLKTANKKHQKDSVAIPPYFRTVQHIKKPMLSLVFTYENPVRGRVASTAGSTENAFCRLAIFSHKKGKMLTDFEFAGFRRHDFERGLPCATALLDDGFFTLLNKEGQQLKGQDGKALKLSYIGEFINGLARASVGGKIRKVANPSENKFSVIDRYLFWQMFGLTNPLVQSLSQEVRLMVDSSHNEVPLWGFIDTLGQWIIPPIYDYVRDFDEGQAIAVKSGNWGVLDRSNKTVIDFKYASISGYYGNWRISQRSQQTLFFNQRGWQIFSTNYEARGNFSEGFCRVKKGQKWGYIDETGQAVTPFQFPEARDFSNGMAAVKYNNKWAFIDTTGQIVFNTAQLDIPIDTISNFHDGLCWFKSGRKYGFLNQDGNVAIKPKYSMAFDFQHGVARVVDLVDSTGFKTGLINTQGQYILKPDQFERIYQFDQYGLAKVMEAFSAHEYGLINAKGEILTPVKYQEIQDFHQGFAAVKIGKAYGMINQSGKEVIPLEYQNIGTMSEGRVAVMPKIPTKWQYLDTLGNLAFKKNFDIVSSFSKGYAEVTSNMFDPNSRQIIDLNGEPVSFKSGQVQFYNDGIFGMYTTRPLIKGQHYYYANQEGQNFFDRYFQAIEPFQNDVAMITQSWRRGIINKRGMMVIQPKYFFLQIMEDGAIMARPPSFGIADRTGKILIPPIYDNIVYMSGEIYRVEQGEKIGYLTYNGKWIWELQN